MPTKKRKYEARFPPARIKKIMQTDEEIGKVAAAVPVIISRALEIFLQQLVEKSAEYTKAKRAKTMTTGHLKQCIESENQFDFLKDLVSTIADMTNQEEEDNRDSEESKPKKPRRSKATGERKKSARAKKSTKSTSSNESDDEANASEDNEESARVYPRGEGNASERNHVGAADENEDSDSEQGSLTLEKQKSMKTFESEPNSAQAHVMPMLLQSNEDDDEEDYDEDD